MGNGQTSDVWHEPVDFGALVGKTISAITGQTGSTDIRFACDDGTLYALVHYHDLVGTTTIEDIEGDLSDLIGSPVTLAEESTNRDNPRGDKSHTWTFYRIATVKGFVTIRWYGTSDGNYSERVDFARVRNGWHG